MSLSATKQKRMVHKYVRDAQRNPVGVVLVYRSNLGDLKFGYSRCHKHDKFDKNKGLIAALKNSRVLDGNYIKKEDFLYEEDYKNFFEDAKKIIKNARRYFSASPRKDGD